MDTDTGDIQPPTSTTYAEQEQQLTIDELPLLTPHELETHLLHLSTTIDTLSGEINILEEERDKMKGNVNMSALMEYLRKDASYRQRLNELESITEERNNMRRVYEGLRKQRLEEFMIGFGSITLKLKEMYQMITLGKRLVYLLVVSCNVIYIAHT